MRLYLQELAELHLLESHGHSAPIEIVQAYINQRFTLEICHVELADKADIFLLFTATINLLVILKLV